jgi:predicted DNA-binding protein
MSKPKSTSIRIDAEQYQMLKEYSALKDVPMSEVVGEAIQDWLECVGGVRLNALARQQAQA